MMGESLYIYFNIISFYCCICIAKVAVFLNKPQRSISRCDDGGGGAFLIVHTYCTVCSCGKASVAAALLIIYEFCGHYAKPVSVGQGQFLVSQTPNHLGVAVSIKRQSQWGGHNNYCWFIKLIISRYLLFWCSWRISTRSGGAPISSFRSTCLSRTF